MKSADNRKSEILQFINEYYDENGTIPTVRDVAAGTGIPVATVHRQLTRMREDGEIEYSGRKGIGTVRMEKEHGHIGVPVLGEVRCGPGDYEEENILEYIRLPESLIGKGKFFALIAKGDSMTGVGIHPGDHVIVRQQNHANEGDIIVALYDDGMNNLKELHYDPQGRPVLCSCNPDYEDIYPEQLLIQGVAVYVMHRLSPSLRNG